MHYKHLFIEDEKDLVESLKLEFNESGDAPLESAGSVASVAKLLIVFFEELPEPLIPITSQQDFIKGMESKLRKFSQNDYHFEVFLVLFF